MIGFMSDLVKMQKIKLMKELGIPLDEILKKVDFDMPAATNQAEAKEAKKRATIADAQQVVAAQMKKIKLV